MTVIVNIKTIHQLFHRAHNHIIEQLGGDRAIFHAANHKFGNAVQLMQQSWTETYNVKIITDSRGSWEAIEFKDDKHFLMFCLSWS